MLPAGIGFAKTAHGNIELLRDLRTFSSSLPGCLRRQPILLGSSRKSFLGKATGSKIPIYSQFRLELAQREHPLRSSVSLIQTQQEGLCAGIADPQQRDMASAVAAALAVAQGATIIRMHNVKAGVQAATIADLITRPIAGNVNPSLPMQT